MPKIPRLFVMLWAVLWAPWSHAAFDHNHSAWDALLRTQVVVAPEGNVSTVRYGVLKADHTQLSAYLGQLSTVSQQEYAQWTRPRQLAFLINAYNAYTVELILTRYPDLKSIKDLGSIVQSPWKKKFFRLLDEPRNLDAIEHDLIRAPGVFDDPRIHFAVVCASVGCPMLRNEAYTADKLDAQLDEALLRFLSDRSRNRFEPATGTLKVSSIFDWYGKDFERGYKGFDTLKMLFSRHADHLTQDARAQASIRAGTYKLEFLPYDWGLNDASPQGLRRLSSDKSLR